MKIVTVINNETHFVFNLLRLSCALNNLKLIVLVSNDESFKNLHIKDELLKEYLSDTEDDELIFFTDGNDAIFSASENEIIEKFEKFGKDIVFSAETSCWPDKALVNEYPITDNSPYQYLNSGGFVGRAKTVRNLLDDNSYDLKKYPNSNQYLWTNRYLKHPDKICIDTQCEIFCTFSTELGNTLLPTSEEGTQDRYYEFMKQWFNQNFIISNNKIFNKTTATWPCHYHFNGFSQYLIDHTIIDMVYSKINGGGQVDFFYK